MARCLRLLACLLALTCARAEDYVSWEMTPPVAGPGQPFKLQVRIESDVILGPADRVGRELKPPKGMALRFSGQLFRANTTEATLNFSGVAPEEEGAHVIPAFSIRFPAKLVKVPAMTVNVSAATGYRREGQARAELAMPTRTYYVGERIPGAILLKGSQQEMVNGSFGLECEAEGFTFQQVGPRNEELPDGQGIQTGFELTPLRTGTSEVVIGGIMLVNTGGLGGFTAGGRDRPFTFRRKITVEHVPEAGRPPEWNGAIGRFLAESVTVSNAKPEVGEPIRLRAVLAGEGNLDRILPPEIGGNETWDVVPGNDRRFRRAEDQRSFTYTLVPRLPGKLLTPAIRFAVFDPETRTFQRLEFAPQEVNVTGNAPAKVDLVSVDPGAAAGAPAAQALTGLATPDPRARGLLDPGAPTVAPLAASRPFWTANLTLLTLSATLFAAAAGSAYLLAHPEILRRARARREVRAARRAAAAATDEAGFAVACVRGLRAGCAPRLEAAPEALTQGDVRRVLPAADGAALDRLFRRADGAKFGAPSDAALLAEKPAFLALLAELEARL
ncbi:MAG: hypothetical protein RLZZ550_1269 [Verrucomicrobiota bacterium]|jgi:hypothetical protein